MKQSKLKNVKSLGTTWEKNGTIFYNQWVAWENGDEGGASSKTPEAKWKVGEEYTYDVRVNGSHTNFFGIKPLNSSGGYREKPINIFCLELSRKMYNSSQQTDEKWGVDQMFGMASWLMRKYKDGCSRTAMETSSTIECSFAVNGQKIDTKRLSDNITATDEWLKNNQ